MKNPARLTLSLPGETARESWSREGEGVWRKQSGTASGEGCVLGMEVLALDSMPMWAVIPEGGRADVAGVASLRWEGLGVQADDAGGKSWTHWSGGEDGSRLLVASAGLASEAPVAEWQKCQPEHFEISARAFPIPPGEMAIWRELGRIVVAFTRSDRLVHFGALSARTLDAAAAEEIRDLVWSLEVQEFITKLKGVRVWTATEPGFEEALKALLDARVVTEEKPAPVLPAVACDLLPAEIAQARRDRAVQQKRARLILALATMYVAFFAIWAGYLYFREKKVLGEQAELALQRPAVEEVRKAHAHWLAMEPATTPDTYPTEIFDRLVKLLPDQGIQFKEFTLNQSKLAIGGEASSVSHAKRFQGDVVNSPDLKQFAWIFPEPVVLDDGRAKFTAEGKINTEGGDNHESQ